MPEDKNLEQEEKKENPAQQADKPEQKKRTSLGVRILEALFDSDAARKTLLYRFLNLLFGPKDDENEKKKKSEAQKNLTEAEKKSDAEKDKLGAEKDKDGADKKKSDAEKEKEGVKTENSEVKKEKEKTEAEKAKENEKEKEKEKAEKGAAKKSGEKKEEDLTLQERANKNLGRLHEKHNYKLQKERAEKSEKNRDGMAVLQEKAMQAVRRVQDYLKNDMVLNAAQQKEMVQDLKTIAFASMVDLEGKRRMDGKQGPIEQKVRGAKDERQLNSAIDTMKLPGNGEITKDMVKELFGNKDNFNQMLSGMVQKAKDDAGRSRNIKIQNKERIRSKSPEKNRGERRHSPRSIKTF